MLGAIETVLGAIEKPCPRQDGQVRLIGEQSIDASRQIRDLLIENAAIRRRILAHPKPDR